MRDILRLLAMSEAQVWAYIESVLIKHDIPYLKTDHYIVTQITKEPVPLICVHTDTVTNISPRPFDLLQSKRGIISLRPLSKATALGADDRAGVWIALKMIENGTKTVFNYAFFTGEETGAIGSNRFAVDEYFDYTCFIGLDRACRKNRQNVALYGEDNDELTKYFEDLGYERAKGSFTDCSVLAANFGLACVNLSVGYQMEHSKMEFLDTNQMKATLKAISEVEIENREFKIIRKERRVLCDYCGAHEPLYIIDQCTYVCRVCKAAESFYGRYSRTRWSNNQFNGMFTKTGMRSTTVKNLGDLYPDYDLTESELSDDDLKVGHFDPREDENFIEGFFEDEENSEKIKNLTWEKD